MKRAWLNLRYTENDRAQIFKQGFERLGYTVSFDRPLAIHDGDVYCTWNRIHHGHVIAQEFERRGLPVIVAENATWGNEFCGERWYTLALDYHNVAGKFPFLGNERWDSLNVQLEAFREEGETILLPSRGIGPSVHRMPSNWIERMRAVYPNARVRSHPGQRQAVELREDLRNCGRVVTWGSGAAIKALMLGCKVESHMPSWIGEQDNTEEGRLAMFRKLAWGQVRLDELRSGEAFRRLLEYSDK